VCTEVGVGGKRCCAMMAAAQHARARVQ